MAVLLVGLMGVSPSAKAEHASAPADDGGSGGDAGNTFETATAVQPSGRYTGRLLRSTGDTDDFYKFFLPAGASTSVLLEFTRALTEPVTLLDPAGRVVDTGTSVLNAGASASGAMTTETYGLRLAVHHAVVPGEYRLHLSGRQLDLSLYSMCFMNCEGVVDAPIDFIFEGSLPNAHTKVLLVPPTHGDLGNPAGPSVTDYIDATLRGIRNWETALVAFATDYPEYAYLKNIDVDIEIFDGITPADPVGYDVVIGYVAAGPIFRGVASSSVEGLSRWLVGGTNDEGVRSTGRLIALSLFGGSPRAGQVAYDFPEENDLENVTMHEFAHTFGLGHTTTWHPEHGPDLMNSPATFIYGDGWAGGFGTERTPRDCLSSLDLYGMAQLYRWLPSGDWQPSYGSTSLPKNIPYKLYC